VGDLFSIIIIMSVASIVLSAGTYAQGFKDGKRQGYAKGRAVSRHAASRVNS
jgi:flagellar biosynthesis/type III secretory pathway protein FliH